MDLAKELSSLALTILSASAIVGGFILWIVSKYRKPFEELREHVDTQDKRNEERLNELESREDTCGKHFDNDKQAIEQLRRDVNRLYGVTADNNEGIMLCMQHEVKGNHTELLEQWMRQNARHTIERN